MTNLLQLLKSLGKFDVPIIVLQHHPPITGKLDAIRYLIEKNIWKGAKHIICLSKNAKNSIQKKFNCSFRMSTVQWGPDVDFYLQPTYPGEGLCIAGRTGRDFETVIKAVQNTKVKTNIFYIKGDIKDNQPLSNNIKLHPSNDEQPEPGVPKKGWLRQRELLTYFQKARVIGIPLHLQNTLAGLTSLMDALGSGKPVIMTRNLNIDIDIEKEGIGHWVDPGDVGSWKRILKWYNENPDDAAEMGRKSRLLAKKKYNSKTFASSLIKVIHKEFKHGNCL